MSMLSLPAVVADLDRLPALPEVAQQLIDCLQQVEVEIAQVAHVISRDPALAAKLLRVANSSFYGLQGQVATINDALVVLGLRAVRTLATAAALTTHLQRLQAGGYDHHTFWSHSAGTAICARALARRQGGNPENAFTAGLLHDIGQFILAVRFPEVHRSIVAHRAEKDCYRLEAEREVLGFDHTQIGAALAERWKFPAEITEAIAWHHDPVDQPAESLGVLMHIADIMAHALDFPGDEDDLVPRLSSISWSRLGIGWGEFKSLLAEVDNQRDDVARVLS